MSFTSPTKYPKTLVVLLLFQHKGNSVESETKVVKNKKGFRAINLVSVQREKLLVYESIIFTLS